MKLTGKKLLLLLLMQSYSDSGSLPIAGRTRLMKMVFLFEKELWPEIKKERPSDEFVLPEFFAWKYGPFSSELLDDLEFLVNRDFVCVQKGSRVINEELEEYEYWLDSGQNESSEYVGEEFSLTGKGDEKAKEVWDALSDSQKALIKDFREVLAKASLSKILEYVYKKYEKEGFTGRSLIRDRYLKS
jgi:uncharacterized protein YwgA